MLFNPDNSANIPLVLRETPRWVNWEAVPRADGRVGKVPINPHTPPRHASSTDPRTWAPFDLSVGVSVGSGGTYGIGFVFSRDDAIFGLDLDHCLTANSDTWSHRVLERFPPTYVEVSPSREGLHLYAYGAVPRSIKTARGELYGWGRFFTVTGETLAGSAPGLATIPTKDMAWLVQTLTDKPTPPLSAAAETAADWNAIELDDEDANPPPFEEFQAICQKHPRFYSIFCGTGKSYRSPSEAEMALGRTLVEAGWGDQDIYRVWRAYRAKHGHPDPHVTKYKVTLHTLRQTHADGTQTPPTQADHQAHAHHVLGVDFTRFVCVGSPGTYYLVTPDGESLKLGDFATTEKQVTWRSLLHAHYHHWLPPLSGKRWLDTLTSLMALCEYDANPDSAESAETLAWIDQYFASERAPRAPTYQSLTDGQPCLVNDRRALSIHQMLTYLRTQHVPNLRLRDFSARLKVLGWTPIQLGRKDANGKTINKHYWCAP